jgi:hypothetical protein
MHSVMIHASSMMPKPARSTKRGRSKSDSAEKKFRPPPPIGWETPKLASSKTDQEAEYQFCNPFRPKALVPFALLVIRSKSDLEAPSCSSPSSTSFPSVWRRGKVVAMAGRKSNRILKLRPAEYFANRGKPGKVLGNVPATTPPPPTHGREATLRRCTILSRKELRSAVLLALGSRIVQEGPSVFWKGTDPESWCLIRVPSRSHLSTGFTPNPAAVW